MDSAAQSTAVNASVHYSIADIEKADWDECTSSTPYNPFVDYRFLRALEDSKSVGPDVGWQPFHVQIEQEGEILGVMPMYLKSHSRGEFVFDGSWANALYSAGGRYYPKMQCCVPFTPATGPRLLVKPGPEPDERRRQLLIAAAAIARQVEVTNLHITFLCEDEAVLAEELGYLKRVDMQFHWHNDNYESFDQFLETFSSKKRKNVRQERRKALAEGIEIEWLRGSTLTEKHWDAFYQFYMDTGYRKWGTPYLNREFFSRLHEAIPEQVLLILCSRNKRYIAGALNLIGVDTLYGRYWGCTEDQRFLHFETCYYQAIDYAIANKLQHVEAGAQGGHKIARGYIPNHTYSVHWLADGSFRDAVENFLKQEKHYVQEEIEYLAARSPYNTTVDFDAYRQTTRTI